MAKTTREDIEQEVKGNKALYEDIVEHLRDNEFSKTMASMDLSLVPQRMRATAMEQFGKLSNMLMSGSGMASTHVETSVYGNVFSIVRACTDEEMFEAAVNHLYYQRLSDEAKSEKSEKIAAGN